jgi:hypothetical protein
VLLHQDRHGEAELAAMLGIGRKALWMRRRSWGLYRHGDSRGRGSDAPHSPDDELPGRLQ